MHLFCVPIHLKKKNVLGYVSLQALFERVVGIDFTKV